MTRAPPAPPFARASPWPRSRPTVDVRLSDGTSLHPRAIVGADGPRSVVGRAIGSTEPRSGAGASDPHQAARSARVGARVPCRTLPRRLRLAVPAGPDGQPRLRRGRRGAPGAGARFSLTWRVALARAGIVEPEPLGRTGGAIPVGGIVGPTGRLGRCPGAARGRRRRARPSGDRRRDRGGGAVGNPGRRGCGRGSLRPSGRAAPPTRRSFATCLPAAFDRALVSGARPGRTRSPTARSAAAGRDSPAYWQADGLPV